MGHGHNGALRVMWEWARGHHMPSALALPQGVGNSNLALSMWSLLKEFLQFSKQEKKWWLVPLVVVLLLVGAVLIFTASSGIAWALYPFM